LALKALVTLIVLAIPALAMGATLPLAVVAAGREARVGLRAATLYGINTAGAVLGTLAVGLVLIQTAGLLGALLCGSALNLLAASMALLAQPGDAAAIGGAPSAPASIAGPAPVEAAWLVPTVAASGGLAGMAYEISYARVLHIMMAGTVETVAAVLAAFLTGIALGSAGYRWWGRRRRMDLNRLGWLLVLSALSALAVTVLFEPLAFLCRDLSGRGGLLPALARFAWAGAVLIAPAALNGAIFPAAIDLAPGHGHGAGRTVGRTLAYNTVGAVAGSLLSGTLLIPMLGTTATLYLVTIAVLLVALGCGYLAHRRQLALAVVVSLLLVGTLWPGVDLARLAHLRGVATASYRATQAALDAAMRTVIYAAEGATGVVVLSEPKPGTWTLTLDGLPQASRALASPRFGRESVLLGTIPAALARGEQRALVIGLGGGVTLEALRAVGLEQIDVVELEPRVVEALRRLPDGSAELLELPGATLALADGREFLQRQLARGAAGRYDVIASQPAHWWIAGVGNLATLEFYRLVFASLAEGGVYCQWINGSRMTEPVIRGVVGSMQQVFDETLVFAVGHGGLYFLVGARAPLQPVREVVARRLTRPAVLALAADSPRDLDDLAAMVVLSGRVPAGAPLPRNRDRDALVESQLAAASTGDELDLAALRPPLLERLGPPAAMLPPTEIARRQLRLETAERRLNTPGGVPRLLADGLDGLLPFGPLSPGLARLAVTAAQPALDGCWRRYLQARLQLLDGPLAAGRAALAQACPQPPGHPAAQRAARLVALLDRDSGRCQSGLDALLASDTSTTLGHYLAGLLRQCLGQDPASDYRAALADWHELPLPGTALQWAVANREPIAAALLERARADDVIDAAALQAGLAADVARPDQGDLARRARLLARLLDQRALLLRTRARRLEQAGDLERAEVQYARWHASMPTDPAATLAYVGFLERSGRGAEAERVRRQFVASARDVDEARRILQVAGSRLPSSSD
ncbi:MAG: fused MFS/spermidine synthase, partial [Deltaproteobacteria bacterium]|nr:fused MFS/spermidine synthase [Deltaproteobacteria bacterium]